MFQKKVLVGKKLEFTGNRAHLKGTRCLGSDELVYNRV